MIFLSVPGQAGLPIYTFQVRIKLVRVPILFVPRQKSSGEWAHGGV